MTILNVIGLISFLLITLIGSFVKIKTRKKVKGIEGFTGFVNKEKEYQSGKFIGNFGE